LNSWIKKAPDERTRAGGQGYQNGRKMMSRSAIKRRYPEWILT
jgi:hypothetical protein